MATQAETNKTILMVQKWGGMLIIFLTIVLLNTRSGFGGTKSPLYIYALASWFVLSFLALLYLLKLKSRRS